MRSPESIKPREVFALQKPYYKIGEVAEIVGVEPSVLRYWESEFRTIRPEKTRGQQRVYRKQDVTSALLIKQLLYQEGYRIDGAKRRLRELGRGGQVEISFEIRLRQGVKWAISELEEALKKDEEDL